MGSNRTLGMQGGTVHLMCMRAWPIAILAIAVFAAAGCSDSKTPPEGRWQGVYRDDGVMIAARVEVGGDGRVRLSAPNAFMDFAHMEPADIAGVERTLAVNLAAAWPKVAPRTLDFDGRVFRNPGGVAPQLEWTPNGHMTMFVYPGSKPTIRIELEATREFAN